MCEYQVKPIFMLCGVEYCRGLVLIGKDENVAMTIY